MAEAQRDTAPDDVFIRMPEPKHVTVEFTRPRRFLLWTWDEHVRQTYDFAPLPMYRLIALDMVYDGLLRQKVKRGETPRVTMREAVATLIGPDAFYIPMNAVEAMWDAHCEANEIPKVRRVVVGESPSPTEHSSDDSKSTRSTSPSGPSSE